MRPLEVTSVYGGMEIIEPSTDMPIRTYSPKLKEKIIDMPKNGHKPGFFGQAKDFMNFCMGRDDCVGADIEDAYLALKLAQSLVDA